jgi:hypothetical protein
MQRGEADAGKLIVEMDLGDGKEKWLRRNEWRAE